jgi:Pvc16 N-terminal domain
MANYLAIAAVARTVLKLLEDHCPRDEFISTPGFALHSGPEGGIKVEEGFTLLVWRVAVNATMRNQPPRRMPDGRKRRPALPVDLWLMITPWSTEAERQLRLMGWAMRFIEDHAILPAALLNQSLTRQDRPAFEPDEGVEIFHEAPPLADYLGLWDKFRNRWQTSLTYGVRMVSIESDIVTDEGALVRTRDLRAGQPAAPEAAR